MIKKGDKIAIVSPSSCIEKNALDLSIAWFRNLGFEVVIMPHVYDAKTYTAGADFDRAEDINRAFADVTVKAIFCSRGGSGATKMLKYLDFDLIKKNHKPI
ncbi:MAG: LD-carboxypeptidase, partial [Alphaproteobacteria bacterium]|nr:LD-carboxypeptidase [Alphaproteobacteria bacterium]